jgi:hypothetical protein
LMHQYIIASYHARTRARESPPMLCYSAIAKQSCRGPCAVALTSEQRSPGHWQAPPKKHAMRGNNTAGNRISRRAAGVWIYRRERPFRRPGNSGRHGLSQEIGMDSSFREFNKRKLWPHYTQNSRSFGPHPIRRPPHPVTSYRSSFAKEGAHYDHARASLSNCLRVTRSFRF